MKKVLILGSGGREHAIAVSLADDEKVSKIYCAPGNGGTASICENVDLDILNSSNLLKFVEKKNIDLTIVGPEAPLAGGIVDEFQKTDKQIFGPDKFGARLESSKIFAREIMAKYNVPSPKYFACLSQIECEQAKNEIGLPVVVKADGLAGGKGVLICESEMDFNSAMVTMFDEKSFGTAGEKVSLEQCLIGEELSVFAVCDGNDYVILNSAQDHKRAFDGDQGPNTGGMGAYSPTPLSTPEMLEKVGETIIKPTLDGMSAEGHPFKGFLYAGVMIVDGEPFVIEFNVRMGDPEAQVILPLLESPLFDLFYFSAKGEITKAKIQISNKTAVTVVLAAEGYPAGYPKGMEIHGLDNLKNELVYHAGTRLEDDKIITNGGRVLNVVGFGDNLQNAIDDAYRIVDLIDFSGKYYRKDIGQRGLKYILEK